MRNESMLNVQQQLIEKCTQLLKDRYTKKSLYEAMHMTAPELNHFLDEGKPTDKVLQKVANHPLINLEVVKSYKLIEGKK